MTSIKRAGRITTFGFAVGAGLLIASGAGAAVAAAAPDDSGHSPSSSSSASSSSSPSARSGRPSSNAAAKAKPARSTTARVDYSAPVVQLRSSNRTPAEVATPVATTPTLSAATTTPTKAAAQATAKRVAALPTPSEVQQSIAGGLDEARRRLDELRGKIQTLVENQIIGWQDNLVTLRIDLERIFNPNKQIIYGNLANSQYWAAGGAQTASLMAAAMVISAVTGQTVTAQDIITEAMNTDSVSIEGYKMYGGPTTGDWVWASDAVQLMENHGVKTTTVYYTKTQEQRALNAVKTALAQGKSVIVSINGTVTSAQIGEDKVWTTEHQVVLLGINVTKNLVYLNDGANPDGQNLTMPIDEFLTAWQASRYTTVIAELAPVTAQVTQAAAIGTIAA